MSFLQRNVWPSDLPSTIDFDQSSSIYTTSDINQWNIELRENETTENRAEYSDKIVGGKCSFILCFIIGLLLGGIALAVVTTLWLTSSTTSISSTVSTTTSIICTTSTVTTATSTKTTTTTQTTTTTSVTTTTTTPTPSCPPISVGSSSIIYNASSGNQYSYECHAFLWTSNTTGLVNITFQLQNLPSYWLIDDVSVNNGAAEMLSNGGFETGSLSPWVRTAPFGICGGSDGQVRRGLAYTGTYCLLDGSDNCPDLISQTFSVTNGQIYTISFWLQVQGTGPEISIVLYVS